jgi:hypothetical protein
VEKKRKYVNYISCMGAFHFFENVSKIPLFCFNKTHNIVH